MTLGTEAELIEEAGDINAWVGDADLATKREKGTACILRLGCSYGSWSKFWRDNEELKEYDWLIRWSQSHSVTPNTAKHSNYVFEKYIFFEEYWLVYITG